MSLLALLTQVVNDRVSVATFGWRAVDFDDGMAPLTSIGNFGFDMGRFCQEAKHFLQIP